jgi:hypothetical protein
VLIIEGPDGSGKTTLAKRVVDVLGMEYRRYPGLSPEAGPDGVGIVEWWDEQIQLNDQEACYDRCFYISELLYQPVTPGRQLLTTPTKIAEGIAELWTLEPQIVFCLPEWILTKGPIQARPQLKGVTEEGLEKVHWGYHGLYAMWKNSLFEEVRMWDYTKDNLDDLVSWVAG